jgi:MbtH protein
VPNLFDDENQPYLVLVNDLNQHSLWPASLPSPNGWRAISGPLGRSAAIQFVDDHWTDLRPASRSL